MILGKLNSHLSSEGFALFSAFIDVYSNTEWLHHLCKRQCSILTAQKGIILLADSLICMTFCKQELNCNSGLWKVFCCCNSVSVMFCNNVELSTIRILGANLITSC